MRAAEPQDLSRRMVNRLPLRCRLHMCACSPPALPACLPAPSPAPPPPPTPTPPHHHPPPPPGSPLALRTSSCCASSASPSSGGVLRRQTSCWCRSLRPLSSGRWDAADRSRCASCRRAAFCQSIGAQQQLRPAAASLSPCRMLTRRTGSPLAQRALSAVPARATPRSMQTQLTLDSFLTKSEQFAKIKSKRLQQVRGPHTLWQILGWNRGGRLAVASLACTERAQPHIVCRYGC